MGVKREAWSVTQNLSNMTGTLERVIYMLHWGNRRLDWRPPKSFESDSSGSGSLRSSPQHHQRGGEREGENEKEWTKERVYFSLHLFSANNPAASASHPCFFSATIGQLAKALHVCFTNYLPWSSVTRNQASPPPPQLNSSLQVHVIPDISLSKDIVTYT